MIQDIKNTVKENKFEQKESQEKFRIEKLIDEIPNDLRRSLLRADTSFRG